MSLLFFSWYSQRKSFRESPVGFCLLFPVQYDTPLMIETLSPSLIRRILPITSSLKKLGRRGACPNDELYEMYFENGWVLTSTVHYPCLLVSSGIRVLSGFMDIWKIWRAHSPKRWKGLLKSSLDVPLLISQNFYASMKYDDVFRNTLFFWKGDKICKILTLGCSHRIISLKRTWRCLHLKTETDHPITNLWTHPKCRNTPKNT